MCPKYVLFFFLNAQICWSYLVSPQDPLLQTTPTTPNFQDVGEPLILTPYIRSNEISKARILSTVEPLLTGSGIASNSGYFTVDEKYNSNLFFWFFRKTSDDWKEAPLLLWLQGGPGFSSLFGLFEENGPYTVTENCLERRNISWINDYNVLYIDQPVGTGFSFTNSSNEYFHTQEKVADHLYEALIQFLQLYPELRQNAFYVTGESYAGKYIPAIAYKIHSLKKTNQSDINLKGLFMISAFTNGVQNGLVNFCIQVGIIDSKAKYELEPMEEEIESLILSRSWSRAFDLSILLLSAISQQSNVSMYDYTKSRDSENYETYSEFVKKCDIRKKLHVGNTEYSLISWNIYNALKEDVPKSVIPWVEELLEHYPIAFVGGQFDIRVAYPVVSNTIKKLEWSGAFKYSKAKRNTFYSGERVAGYYKSAGNLKDILIRGAGHSVPKDQPRATLELLRKFVNNGLYG